MTTATLDPPATNGKPHTDTATKDTQSIFAEKFLQVSLTPHRPELSVKLTPQRLERHQVKLTTAIDDATVDTASQESLENQIQLLEKSERNMLNEAYKKVKDFFEDPAMTLPYPAIKGLRVLPLSRRELFFDTWPAVQTRFEADLEGFFTIYPAIQLRNRDKWLPKLGNAFWSEIERRHLPPLHRFRDKFSVQVVKGTFTHEDMKDAVEAVELLAKSVRTQLQEALDKLRLSLCDGKKLSLATLNELRSALTAVRSFADLSDTKMIKESDQLEKVLDNVTKDVEDKYKPTGAVTMTAILRGHASTITQAMDSVLSAVSDRRGVDSVMARFGAAPRLIGRRARQEEFARDSD